MEMVVTTGVISRSQGTRAEQALVWVRAFVRKMHIWRWSYTAVRERLELRQLGTQGVRAEEEA
jgi:hypothetical protein